MLDKMREKGIYFPNNEKDNCGVALICNINGEKNNSILKKGLKILSKLRHRGAVGSDDSTGDGAGIMFSIPYDFFNSKLSELSKFKNYAVGMIFFPNDPFERTMYEGIIEFEIEREGLEVIMWRDVPTNDFALGELAKSTKPFIRQIFVKNNNRENFEQILYVVRRRIEKKINSFNNPYSQKFYICSFSSKKIIYKGQILGHKLKQYFQDLCDNRLKTSFCIVHERYSTNTFPSWKLAQPFRFVAHNGEFNTINANKNWMKAREGAMISEVFSNNLSDILPVIDYTMSDSGSFDNVFEFLYMNNLELDYIASFMIPKIKYSSKDEAAFYEYNARIMEPWDGPSTIVFSNGEKLGILVDRNGLRPARYTLSSKNEFIMASEVGVIEFKDDEVLKRGMLDAGEIMLIDLIDKKIIYDEEIKEKLVKQNNYASWVQKNRIELKKYIEKYTLIRSEKSIIRKQKLFNYSLEEIEFYLEQLANNSDENIGSMGSDVQKSVFSSEPQLIYNYFRQKFAQVTNPPLDPFREKDVMDLNQYLGGYGKRIDKIEIDNNVKYIKTNGVIINNSELEYLKKLDNEYFKCAEIPIIFQVDKENSLRESLEILKKRVQDIVEEKYNIIVLSDRKADLYNAGIPSLLALRVVHNHLLKIKSRKKIDIIVETGDCRDIMHFALLIGYGAKLINPYLAFDSIYIRNIENSKDRINNYIKAINTGILKIMSKVGISALASYSGAEMFEIMGLDREIVTNYFQNTNNVIEEVGLEKLEEYIIKFHKNAFKLDGSLSEGGYYNFKYRSEKHLLNIDIAKRFIKSIRNDSFKEFKGISEEINNRKINIRNHFKLKYLEKSAELQVESVDSIIKKFVISGMSYGSISDLAHKDIALAANTLGIKSNSGEGGESLSRLMSKGEQQDFNNKIKQISTARFGVDINYIISADELQIKMAQGAKPGEGGHLPKEKVTKDIAKIRFSKENIELISPPPHHDIYSIEDLAQLIYDLKNVNNDAKISVKLVSKLGIGTIATGVVKANANIIVISGDDGGTGASKYSSMRYAGMPWEVGLTDTHVSLLVNNLRGRVKLRVDGKMFTAYDVIVASILGAEEFGFATSILMSLGCINCRKCHLGKCPVGIATQNKKLREKYKGNYEHIIRYFEFLAKDIQIILKKIGVTSLNDLIGRIDLIDVVNGKYDFSKLLYRPLLPKRIRKKFFEFRNINFEDTIDMEIFNSKFYDIKNGNSFFIERKIKNIDRSVGSLLSGKIAKFKFEDENYKLNNFIFKIKLNGYAGQTFGGFLDNSIELILNGEANDYVAKGLSGGRIIIEKKDVSEDILAGNTVLFGATSGELYVAGMCGHRFAVRNSGAVAVIEGAKNNAFEYMTGGEILVLGKLGTNIASGMTGGKVYVLDTLELHENINKEYVKVDKLENLEKKRVVELLKKHYEFTKSDIAKRIIEDVSKNFDIIKVIKPI